MKFRTDTSIRCSNRWKASCKIYKVTKDEVSEVLALIHTHDDEGNLLFEKDSDGGYIHRLRIQKRNAERMRDDRLLFNEEDLPDKHNLSFHYTPYNFDTKPEREFFEVILDSLNTSVEDVEIFLFTGGLTDPKKTDFHFEYKGIDDNYHHYFPDFVIVKNTGEFYIVEIKSERDRNNPTVEAKRRQSNVWRSYNPMLVSNTTSSIPTLHL